MKFAMWAGRYGSVEGLTVCVSAEKRWQWFSSRLLLQTPLLIFVLPVTHLILTNLEAEIKTTSRLAFF